MLFEIDESLELKELDLYIAKPNKEIIGHLSEAYHKNLFPKMGSLSELSFNIPFQIEKNNRLINNKNINKLKDRYLIKAIYDNKVEWFRISENNNSSDENGDIKEIHAFSLGIELGDKIASRINEVSKDAQFMLNLCLSETGWSAGLVDNELLGKFRSFEIMETTRLDFLYQIAETYRGVVVWDTVNRQINLRAQDNVGNNKGLRISYGKYLKSLKKESNSDEMVTRLIPRGRNDLTIRSISPTGADYMDDFSYFLYPFQRDENKNTVQSSDYMSDELCHALLDYTELLASKEGTFTSLLGEKNELNDTLLVKSGELSNLRAEYIQILDSIEIEQSNGRSITELTQQKETKEVEIRAKESEIANIQSQLDSNQSSMQALQSSLSPENNFSSDELLELNSYIIEKRWTDENIIDVDDLLKEAEKVFEEMRKPKTIITIDIVNFLQLLEGEKDWGKLNIGDTIYIEHEKLNVNITAKIIEFEINFEEQTINLTIANTAEILSDEDKFYQRLYESQQTSLTVDLDKYKWNKTGETVSEIGKLIEHEWDATERRIVAGVNESVVIDNRGISITNPERPNEVLIAQAGVLAISDDNRETWKHAITGQGIVGERIFGKLLAGERLVIDASNQHGTSIFRVDGSGVTIEGTALNIVGGITEEHLSDEYIQKIDTEIEEVSDAVDQLEADVDDMFSDAKLTQLESQTLELSLSRLESESLDLIHVAIELEITTEKESYTNALTDLDTYLTANFVSKSSYPIDISTAQRNEIKSKFDSVDNAKSILVNKIISVRERNAKDSSVGKGELLNGVKIDASEGLTVSRTDNKVKTTLNATTGIKIEKNNGTSSYPNWEDIFYADTDGNLVANNLVTRKISIRDSDDNTIIDANTGTIDFSKFPNKIGILDLDNIPSLTANKITSGTIDANFVNVINLNANNINSGSISADRISGGTITGISFVSSGYSADGEHYRNLEIDKGSISFQYMDDTGYAMLNPKKLEMGNKNPHISESVFYIVVDDYSSEIVSDKSLWVESPMTYFSGEVSFYNAVVSGLDITAKFG